MSNIQNGFVRNILTDDHDASNLRFYVKDGEGLVVAARTTEGFISYLISKCTKVLTRDELTQDFINKINMSAADLSFAVVDDEGDVHLICIDADGYEYTDTPFDFSDIWEVTYDDYEEFIEEFPVELFNSFDIVF